jgi:hypothetical protein
MFDEKIKVFRFKKGKVIEGKANRFVKRKGKPDYKNRVAKRMIKDELKSMSFEIKSSEKARSFLMPKENSYQFSHRVYIKSTFPSYLKETKINTTKDFNKVLKSGKGKRFDRLKKVAIDRLEHGYENEHGRDMPSIKFLKKTKQIYDNKNVIFRKVRGRIVPMRIPKRNRYDILPDAPF